jgi:hypothetical protein
MGQVPPETSWKEYTSVRSGDDSSGFRDTTTQVKLKRPRRWDDERVSAAVGPHFLGHDMLFLHLAWQHAAPAGQGLPCGRHLGVFEGRAGMRKRDVSACRRKHQASPSPPCRVGMARVVQGLSHRNHSWDSLMR